MNCSYYSSSFCEKEEWKIFFRLIVDSARFETFLGLFKPISNSIYIFVLTVIQEATKEFKTLVESRLWCCKSLSGMITLASTLGD